MSLDEIEGRHQRNAVPDPHPESHDCRECSDARDLAALVAVVREVEEIREWIRRHQFMRVEVSSAEVARRLDAAVQSLTATRPTPPTTDSPNEGTNA